MKHFNPSYLLITALLLFITFGLSACGGSNEPVAPTVIDKPTTGASKPPLITIAKELSPQSSDTIGSGQREVDALRKVGVGVKSETCAFRVFTDGFFTRSPVSLLAEIEASDALKAVQLGFQIESEESLKVGFRDPFACASLLY